MKELSQYADYFRREVHNIFAPETSFTEGSGTWGNHGVVRIPNRPGDWVFFVTFGQKVDTHTFEEAVSSEGVLTWQSQPSQDLKERRIEEWIRHDELKNSIYLFLRTKKGVDVPYTYLGKLRYLSHDRDSKKPVHFLWQILDWRMDASAAEGIGLELKQSPIPSAGAIDLSGGLVEIDPPTGRGKTADTTPTFRARKADFSAADARNRALGFDGEKSVIVFEENRLRNTKGALKTIRHVAEVEGDGAGYDILSFDPDGTELYIEVKTTRGNELSDFYLSANELAFFKAHPEKFAIYRVCEFDPATRSGKIFILRGEDISNLSLEPVSYRARR